MIYSRWLLVECDLQDAGVDIEDAMMSARSWRWLRTRIIGLAFADTRLARSIQAEQESGKGAEPTDPGSGEGVSAEDFG